MEKDYSRWHQKKAVVNDVSARPFFHEKEIWFCHLGANVGFEEDGKGSDFMRPVIVYRKFNSIVLWAIPLTRTNKDGKHYFRFTFLKDLDSVAILSQLRLIDARRLSRKIGVIKSEDYQKLTQKLKELLP
ncbi:MAG: type II toxin-antitoxin system PemK/MazF family toxin [Patescibacteria group bacterium]